jgi:hypothetical protein
VWIYGLCTSKLENAIAFAEDDPGSGDDPFDHENNCADVTCSAFQYCDETQPEGEECVCHHTHTLNATTQLCDVTHADRGMVFIDLLYGVDLSGRDADALATAIRDAVRAHFTNYNASDIHVTSMHSGSGATIFNVTIPLADFSAHDQDEALLRARAFLDVALDFTQFARLLTAHNAATMVQSLIHEVHDANGLQSSISFNQPAHDPLGEKGDPDKDVIWWALGGAGLFLIVLLTVVVSYNCTRRKAEEPAPRLKVRGALPSIDEYRVAYFT